jgi:Zn-dependent protease
MAQGPKIYSSFHDLSPREYMYFPKGSLESGPVGKFSSLEIKHLLFAIVVLTFSFAVAFSGNNLLLRRFDIMRLLFSLPIAFLGIITAFFVHELSHKFMAQKYGLWSEFRMNTQGLLLSFIFAIFTGFVFAAPGAVMFQGDTRTFETGRIAVAGPLANLVIASITFVVYRFFLFDSSIGKIIGFVCLINALLAAFNLLPFGPFDGYKVIRWNGIIWAGFFILSLVLLFFILPIAPLF